MSSKTLNTDRRVADEAVARGIAWLDVHVRGWRNKVDADSLALAYPCQCVLGQLDGDFYEAIWRRDLARSQVYELGFAAAPGMSYATLTFAWRRALRAATPHEEPR